MKKVTMSIIVCMMMSAAGVAQKEFTNVYEVKCPISIDTWYSRSDQGLIIAGNDAQLWAMDGVTGKELWKVVYKEMFGVKKCEAWEYEEDHAAIVVRTKGENKGEEVITYLDEMTGKSLGNSETVLKERKSRADSPRVRSKSKSEWIGKGNLYLDNPNVTLSLDYESPRINASYDRGKKRPITVTCSGELTWSRTVEGSFVRSLCDNAFGPSGFGGDFIDLYVSGNCVFVVYEGLSVIDLQTGALLWETTFDFSTFDLGLMKAEMIIGRAPMPVVDETGVYIADLTKDSRAIKKFDLRTGKVIWESERLKKDAIITEMIIVDGVLLVRNGGKVLVQTLITDTNGGQVCKSEYKEEGDFNLVAYDITSGKALWVGDDVKSLGDKFKSISNLETDGKLLYVTSDRNLFALDPKSGAPKYKVSVDDMKIGTPQTIAIYENDILIDAEEGLARVKLSDGAIVYATDTKKNLGSFIEGDVLYVYTGKEPGDLTQFIRFNLATGAIEGGIKDTPNPYFTVDGNEFIKKKDQVFYRFRTN
ncbi:MAG: PQQ-binding-like beta-propeller repeat protein [Flavobacteriales bacterium]